MTGDLCVTGFQSRLKVTSFYYAKHENLSNDTDNFSTFGSANSSKNLEMNEHPSLGNLTKSK